MSYRNVMPNKSLQATRPRLVWMDSVQVKWFAWAAEYPDTSIYGKEAPVQPQK